MHTELILTYKPITHILKYGELVSIEQPAVEEIVTVMWNTTRHSNPNDPCHRVNYATGRLLVEFTTKDLEINPHDPLLAALFQKLKTLDIPKLEYLNFKGPHKTWALEFVKKHEIPEKGGKVQLLHLLVECMALRPVQKSDLIKSPFTVFHPHGFGIFSNPQKKDVIEMLTVQ
jgi:hypothetical protein